MTDRYEVSARLYAIRGGVLFKELRAEKMKVNYSGQAEIQTSLSCRVAYDSDVDFLTDRLRPVQVIDGVAYPMGEFVVATASETRGAGGRGWEVEAYDLALLLKQVTMTAPLRFSAGAHYLDAIETLLASCGIARVMAEPCDLVLEVDREDWEVGANYLTIANELLAAINYGGLWFDRDGVARLGKIKVATVANVTKIYAAGQYSFLCDEITRTADTYCAYNVFTAVCSVPDAPPMVAVAVNDNPLSPISTVRRGRKIGAPTEFVNDIASQEELQAYAEQLRAASLLAVEVIEFETAPIPTHEAGEIIALEGAICQETDWSLSLGFDGSYTHKARRMILI